MPLMSIGAADFMVLLSRVSMATMAAAAESPTKRTPSGPKASGPAGLSSALPVVRPGMLALNATAAVRQTAATSRNELEEITLRIFSPDDWDSTLILVSLLLVRFNGPPRRTLPHLRTAAGIRALGFVPVAPGPGDRLDAP